MFIFSLGRHQVNIGVCELTCKSLNPLLLIEYSLWIKYVPNHKLWKENKKDCEI
jgi:hypothetical protein